MKFSWMMQINEIHDILLRKSMILLYMKTPRVPLGGRRDAPPNPEAGRQPTPCPTMSGWGVWAKARTFHICEDEIAEKIFCMWQDTQHLESSTAYSVTLQLIRMSRDFANYPTTTGFLARPGDQLASAAGFLARANQKLPSADQFLARMKQKLCSATEILHRAALTLSSTMGFLASTGYTLPGHN